MFAIDRAGFVPADGETHQGIYDPAFLSQVGMPIYAPSNYAELTYWLHELLRGAFQGPRAIRYPRGGEDAALAKHPCTGSEYDFLTKKAGTSIVLVSYADEMAELIEAERSLNENSIECDTLKLVKIYPFTDEFIKEISRYDVILFAEECVACGGIGEHLEAALYRSGWKGTYIHRAVENLRLPHATVPQIKEATGLDAAHLAQTIRETVKGETVS